MMLLQFGYVSITTAVNSRHRNTRCE